jgi:hypothetical protein
MDSEEQGAQGEQPAPDLQIIDVVGGGHVVLPDGRGIPGSFANCRLVLNTDTLEIVRSEPLGGVPLAPAENAGEEPISQAGEPESEDQQ